MGISAVVDSWRKSEPSSVAKEQTQPRIQPRLKARTTRFTLVVAVALMLLYGYVFLPTSVLAYLRQQLNSTVAVLTTLGLAGTVGAAIGLLISAQDPLATGRSRASAFFQSCRPSTAIKDHYKCPQAEANTLWFAVFNAWEAPDHPQYNYYYRTFDRSYACRFIYQTRMVLIAFLGLAALAWLTAAMFGLDDATRPIAFARFGLLIVALGATVLLFTINRLNPPTGCWERWKEINDMNIVWLKSELFSSAQDYPAAWTLIHDPNWRSQHGYH
jgi:hypothetical protein